MRLLYHWLKEFVPLEISPEKTAECLERVGFEMSALQNYGKNLRGVVSAEVLEVRKHPNADRLSLCDVSDGEAHYSVVCGAPNVRAGIRVPLAKAGAVLPNGQSVGVARLRGVESQGMICSAAELGLEEKSDGILILGSDAALGQDIRPLLDLDETLMEVEVPANRRDALGMLSIARELSAALNLPLKKPEPRVRESEMANGIALSNEAPELCPRYMARLIRGLRVGPSPAWMARRLTRCGIRSINNIVDITNYVMLELGQPLHAFDALKLRGRQIRIRNAREGETLRTLDGKTVTLDASMLVIADQDKPLALAGIVGGEASGITPDTFEVVLESAAFASGSIRKTRQKLGLNTESSYRFERGSDWSLPALASARAAQLLQDLAGGGVSSKPIESYPRPQVPVAIKLRTERVQKFLGLDLKEPVQADILRRLGCIITMGSGQLHVTVPSWRLDLTAEADVLEEIARVYGYENIPSRSVGLRLTSVPEDPLWAFERRVVRVLVGLGLAEAYSYSFMDARQTPFFSPGFGRSPENAPLGLSNPLSQDASLLRTSLLPGLLQNALTNFHRQIPGVRLFELGRIFDQGPGGCQEVRRLGLLLAGEIQPPHWRQKPKKADFYELLGLVESFLATFRIADVEVTPCMAAAFHPKRSATLASGGVVLGWLGEFHPKLTARLDTREPLVGAELDIAALLQRKPRTLPYQAPSAFPPVHRDLSFIVAENLPYEKIYKVLLASAGPILESYTLIDLYRGGSIGSRKKSMTLSLRFRHRERTLKDAEIEKHMERIKQELEKKCAAKIRQ